MTIASILSLPIAAAAVPPYFVQLALLLVAGAAIAFVCLRLGLIPIVGFLVAGVVIGPHGLGFVRDDGLVNSAAEVGVVLLLYTIGIEFSLARLAKIQRLIFGGGGLQVALASAATMGVLAIFGVDWRAGLFTGFLVALSSTAIVLKLLGDRGETGSMHGQVGLGLLIFQDLAVIVMVLVMPALAGRAGSPLDLVIALGKAGLIIAAVLLLARRIMPRVIEAVARTCSPEIFLLTVIAICFGTALLTNLAGVSLSLGAFLAGLMVSESRFSEYALGEILPLQVLFSATFFVSVGMLLDLGFLVTHLPLVLGAIALVLVIKALTTSASVMALGYRLPVAAAAGFMLAQVGEFSFVLERSGRALGLSPAGMGNDGSQTFIAATVVLMVMTPFLTAAGAGSANKLERRMALVGRGAEPSEPEAVPEEVAALENHVIVAGYGEAARRLTRVLHGSGVPFLITTLSPGGAIEAETAGMPVLRGDATRQRTLTLAGIERAKMLVIPDDDPATAHRITSVARVLNPTMRILVRTRFISEIESLTREGVDLVVAEELEGIVTLFGEVLRDFRIAPEEIEAHEDAVRRGGYAALRSAEGDLMMVKCEFGEHCFDSRTLVIHAGASAVGQTLASLALEARHGIKAEKLVRGGDVLEPPAADVTLAPGDELSLTGEAAAFAAVAPLFRASAGASVAGSAPPMAVAARTATAPGKITAADAERAAAGAPAVSGAAIDTESTIVFTPAVDASVCSHLDRIRPVRPSARGCEDCLRIGDRWVHLRVCLTCGHVGCCDSSKNRHARKHWETTGHPVMRSLQPGEAWGWCFADETEIG